MFRQDGPFSVASGPDGGFWVKIHPPKQNMFLNRDLVSKTLRNVVNNVTGYGDPYVKEKILSILFQRISAMTSLSSKGKIENTQN